MRAARIPLFSRRDHPAGRASSTSSRSTCPPSSPTPTSSTCSTSPASPLHTAERGATDPVVLAGGHCTYNPEPLADFLDAAILGDGEEVVTELHEVIARVAARPTAAERDRRELHLALARLEGVYVPSLYTPRYDDGAARRATTRPTARRPRSRSAPSRTSPTGRTRSAQLVPLTEVVHDRLNVEVFRGCTRGCRFCQAGMITRPVRERPDDQVLADGRATGSSAPATTRSRSRRCRRRTSRGSKTSWARSPRTGPRPTTSPSRCPSLRVDAFTVATAAAIQQVRRTGLTFAPEGGTWRMRRVINKLISDEDLYSAVDAAFSQGWRRIKLYFLIGLPTERDEDVVGDRRARRRVRRDGAGATTRAPR